MKDVWIETKNVNKSFGSIKALKNVSIKIKANEIIGLVGDNGAGKSTLMKILCGVYKPDSGDIYLFGERMKSIKSVPWAMQNGIETIHQDLALVDDLSIADNIFLSREPAKKFGLIKFINNGETVKKTKKILEDVGFAHLDPKLKVDTLSGGERQTIAFTRCKHFKAKVIMMDEPTNNLSVSGTEQVMDYIRHLKATGNVSILYISHNIEQVYSLADKIIILDRGKVLTVVKKENTSVSQIKKMHGRKVLET